MFSQKQSIFVFSCFFITCFFASLLSVPSPVAEKVEDQKTVVPSTPEMLVLAKQLSLKARTLQSQLLKWFDASELDMVLDEANEHLKGIDERLDQLEPGQSQAYEKLIMARTGLKSLRILLDQQLAPLYEALGELYKKNLYWKEEKGKWEGWYSVLLEQSVASSLKDEVRSTIEIIDQTLDMMTQESNVLIEKAIKTNESQNSIIQIENQIEQKIKSKDSMWIGGNSSPLFSREFFAQFKADLHKQLDVNAEAADLQQNRYTTRSVHFVSLQLFFVLVIAGLLIYIRRNSEQSQQMSFLLRPFATGFIVCFILLKTIEPVLSPFWIFAERLMLWIAFLRVFSLYFKNRLVLSFLYVVAVTHVLILLFNVFYFPMSFTRLLIFFGSLTASAFLAAASYSSHKNKTYTLSLVGLGLVFASVAVLDLFGFSTQAHKAFWIVLGSLGVFAIALLSFLMAKELIDWLMQNQGKGRKFFSEENHELVTKLIHLKPLHNHRFR